MQLRYDVITMNYVGLWVYKHQNTTDFRRVLENNKQPTDFKHDALSDRKYGKSRWRGG